MPAVTSSQAEQHSLPWKLPEEVLAESWKRARATPPHHDTHIFFEDCAPSSISRFFVDADLVRDNLSHDLLRREKCPDILLVNEQIYNSTKPFLSKEVSFTICSGACLRKFMELVPETLIHKSMTFYCRIRRKNYTKRTMDGIRGIVAREYGTEVIVVFRKRSNTTQTVRKSHPVYDLILL